MGRWSAIAVVATALFSPNCVQAIPIILPAEVRSVATVGECFGPGRENGPPVPYHKCKSTAYIQKEANSLVGVTDHFKSAFDAWNALGLEGDGPRGGDNKWTLKAGGALPGGEFRVSSFEAWAAMDSGGMNIGLQWEPIPGEVWDGDRNGFVWIQAIRSNYQRGDINDERPGTYAPVDPFFLLDACGATLGVNDARCEGAADPVPAYPIQQNWLLTDMAGGPWPGSFLHAQSFIAQIDAEAHAITVFEGVGWGFHLSVPVPPTHLLLIIGLFGMLLVRSHAKDLAERA
ncbi:MAG TPA: hypothetical protein VLN90_05650 [Thioalkalivibrio sp.]|nr:hypothetical protein [Thioalkalivibrio sp.]